MKIAHVKGKLLNGLEVDISLIAPNGQPVRRFVIAGDNGAGKTILLRSMKYENDDIEVTSIETKDSSYYIQYESFRCVWAKEDDRYAKFFELLDRPLPHRICPSSSDNWLNRLYVSLPTRKDYDGAIFIDDPELGLDARTDSMLGRALETLLPCAQFIYATKSPGLWEHAYSFERVMLLQPGDPRGRREYQNGNE